MRLKTSFAILLAGLSIFPVLAPAIPPHVISDGIVVFEAEDFSTNISPRSSHQWVFTNNVAGFSSNGFMEATPDTGTVLNVAPWTNTSPELQYAMTFNATGTYFVWLRGYATGNTNDSIHWGLDGASNAANGISWTTYSSWIWTNNAAGSAAAISVPSAGSHTFNLWMREDGARIDRIAITSTTNFEPRIGNAWHIPANMEPAIPSMRLPFYSIFSNTAVTIFSGNQFQGGANGANQLGVGSSIFYRNATNATWIELPMVFNNTSGNNKYYRGIIPANTFKAGDTVLYYLRIPYSDRLPTYLYSSNDVSLESEIESTARANPFSYIVQDTPLTGYPSPDDWRDMSIYMLMTDRFYDGDPSNNDLHPEELARPTLGLGIHGGDFAGLQSKLDYIKALGATAIWITPVFITAGTNTGYHGYTAQDFYEISPTWGGLSALTNMIAAAHQRGMRVILDIVCNHQGNRIDSADQQWTNAFKLAGYAPRWTVATNQYPPPFTLLTNFHNNGHISDYNNDQQVELGELRGLDDLRTETMYVRTNMLTIYKHWLGQTDVDAFRLDALKHTDIGFWQLFNPEMRAYAAAMGKTNFFQFGESVSGDAKNGSYTGTKLGAAFCNDSVLDFGLFNSVNSVFISEGATVQIENHYNAITNNFDPAAWYRLVTFIDNHDKSRFMSATSNTNKLNVALDFLYTSRGIPCLYYGTEQNFNGKNLGSGSVPTNREDMFSGQFELGPSIGDNFNETHGTFQRIAKLNNFRRLYPSLQRGAHVNRWKVDSGAGLFAYARQLGTEEVFVVFNTASTTQNLPSRPTLYPQGTTLVNLLNTNESIVVAAGPSTPTISVPSSVAKMFIAESLLKPLDPVVISQTPAHAVTNVPVTTPVVLQFSKPMDTGSVQAAFSVTPSVSGLFSWSSNGQTMTFTPTGLGFASLATNVVRVDTNAMDSVSSNHFYAPFETFFRTASSTLTDAVPPSVSIDLPLGGATQAGPVTVSGTAGDNEAVQSVEVRVDNGNWMSATGTMSWGFFFNSANFPNGSHVLYARAGDSSGNLSDEDSVSVKFFNVPESYEQRISPGNPSDVTNCDGKIWLSDRAYSAGLFGYIGGSAGFVSNTIVGICEQAQSLYLRERFSSPTTFDYTFDCPNGVYEIMLLNAETVFTSAGQRLFDLFINGTHVLTNFDIFAEAGGQNMPITRVFTSNVTNGQLVMHFDAQVDNARASGIQVEKIGDTDTDGDGIPDWWMLAYFDHVSGQEGDASRAEDDADSDGVNNLDEYNTGTDPISNGSYLRFEEIHGFDTILMKYAAVSGRLYSVEYTPEGPSATNWTTLQSDYAVTNVLTSVVDTNKTPLRFYRLRAEKP